MIILSALLLPQPEPEIVVTGRGLEAPASEAVYDVVTLGRERLLLSPSSRLEDVLRDVPGFQLFRRSDARSANPTSQGATLRALGGNASSRALLVLDGVPQTDPFGGWISWPAYDPRRLGQVRIVRGGGSGTAGPGALAGTIELESAGAAEAAGLGGSAAYGSREAVDLFGSAGMELGAGQLVITGAHASGDGFVPLVAAQRGAADRPSPYHQTSGTLRAAVPVGPETELQASALLFHDGRERGTAFSNIVTDGGDGSLRLVGRGRWAWSALGYLQVRSFYNSFAAVTADRSSAARTSEQFNVPSTGLGARFELRPPTAFDLRIGADARQTRGETRELFAFQNGAGTRRRVAGGATRTLGGFAEASWAAGPLVLTGGGRIDRWWIDEGWLQENILATGTVLTDARFAGRSGWERTARGGVAWRTAPGLTLRTAAYLGWRLPTLNELYRPFRVGADATAANAELEPERLRGAEIGAEWTPAPGARIAVTGFVNRLEGAIANVTLGVGPGTFPGVGFVGAGGSYRRRGNLEAIESRGIELDGELALGPWRIAGGYSYADARVEARGAAAPLEGLRPAQTPRHSASLSLGWRGTGGRSAFVAARYAGEQFEDDLNRQTLPDALTFDASAAWPLTRRLALEARAENVLDEQVVAGISGGGLIERATPQTFWIGLRFGG
ncbi:MAG TPA: TonB-dependent receptor [Allosphingosinicella sp.]|nr:TonB-dependent receptor [Allosphingosinicella sp.]